MKMATIRYILAIACFCLGLYLVYDLFANGFDWMILLATIASFVIAHAIKPKADDHSTSDFLDILDLVIELPFRSVALLIRSLGAVFRRGSDGIDFD